MAEIDRLESIKELKENNCVDCACGSSQVPTTECKWNCKHKDATLKAISDMEKLEKIEKAIPDIEHLEKLMIDMFEEWDCFKEHNYFERLGIGIFSEGMQTVSYILDCLRGGEDGKD